MKRSERISRSACSGACGLLGAILGFHCGRAFPLWTVFGIFSGYWIGGLGARTWRQLRIRLIKGRKRSAASYKKFRADMSAQAQLAKDIVRVLHWLTACLTMPAIVMRYSLALAVAIGVATFISTGLSDIALSCHARPGQLARDEAAYIRRGCFGFIVMEFIRRTAASAVVSLVGFMLLRAYLLGYIVILAILPLNIIWYLVCRTACHILTNQRHLPGITCAFVATALMAAAIRLGTPILLAVLGAAALTAFLNEKLGKHIEPDLYLGRLFEIKGTLTFEEFLESCFIPFGELMQRFIPEMPEWCVS